MKKQLLTLVAICAIAMGANAQTEKGDNLIGGSIGFNNSKQKPLNSTNTFSTGNSKSFNIAPRFGHFFGKNLALGLQIGYGGNKSESQSTYFLGSGSPQFINSVDKSHSFNVIPYLRYYVDIVHKFKFFGQANVGMAFGKSTYNLTSSGNYITETTHYKTTYYQASINPGFAFFPTKKWAVELSFPLLAYSKQNMKDDGVNLNSQASSNESFTFGFSSFTPSVGVNLHF
ncbi:outer membrane beta-barrel protein [Pedobacter sp. KACC 23697]|uniref:Outer membrane beta-barrel protein n=1 Tax=Pedobacter sp. KACC 23697 TaxID=3149230 RepID=A0AAU7KBU4_9SPHI